MVMPASNYQIQWVYTWNNWLGCAASFETVGLAMMFQEILMGGAYEYFLTMQL